MSTTPSLSDYQTLASTMEAELDALALGLRTQAAHLHLVRAVGMLGAAVREIGAAIAHEQLQAARAPSNDAPLTVEVVSPGADRADELVRSIPREIRSMSPRTAALRLGAPHNATGTWLVSEVMRRNGWRQLGFDDRWYRVDGLAGAGAVQEQRR